MTKKIRKTQTPQCWIVKVSPGTLNSTYCSKNSVSRPSFGPKNKDKEQLNQQFSSLSMISINIEKRDYGIDFQRTESSPQDRPPIDEPRIITNINTECGMLRTVSGMSDEDIWMYGSNNIMHETLQPPG